MLLVERSREAEPRADGERQEHEADGVRPKVVQLAEDRPDRVDHAVEEPPREPDPHAERRDDGLGEQQVCAAVSKRAGSKP
jgi:hypothetical protein